MTPPDRPWWASEGAGGGQDVDPLEAHRRARRPGGEGTVSDAEPDAAAPTSDADPAASGPGARAPGDVGPGDAASGVEGSWWGPAAEAVIRLAREFAAGAATDPVADATDPTTDPPTDPPTDPTADAADPTADAADGRGAPDHIDACGVCPICTTVRAVGATHPEVVTHLTEAARHLALAVRTVVDAATDDREAAAPRRDRGPRGGSRGDGLQHIDLDGE